VSFRRTVYQVSSQLVATVLSSGFAESTQSTSFYSAFPATSESFIDNYDYASDSDLDSDSDFESDVQELSVPETETVTSTSFTFRLADPPGPISSLYSSVRSSLDFSSQDFSRQNDADSLFINDIGEKSGDRKAMSVQVEEEISSTGKLESEYSNYIYIS
jgi:hypothetical protein